MASSFSRKSLKYLCTASGFYPNNLLSQKTLTCVKDHLLSVLICRIWLNKRYCINQTTDTERYKLSETEKNTWDFGGQFFGQDMKCVQMLV